MHRTITSAVPVELAQRITAIVGAQLQARGNLPGYSVTPGQLIPDGCSVIYDMTSHRIHSVPASDLAHLAELRIEALDIVEAGGSAACMYMSSMQLQEPALLVPLHSVDQVAAKFAGHLQHLYLVQLAPAHLIVELQDIARQAYAAKLTGAPLVRISLASPQLGRNSLLCAVHDAGRLAACLGDRIIGADMETAASVTELIDLCSIGSQDWCCAAA